MPVQTGTAEGMGKLQCGIQQGNIFFSSSALCKLFVYNYVVVIVTR